ncbi:MAG TPA: hypothetical protein VFP68_23305, partial [Burkholderiaceae bacterium]|nr:hypothetical protein [Burkholderiaceae bacterium]
MRADNLSLAAIDALKAKRKVQIPWADNLEELAHACGALRLDNLASAARLEIEQLKDCRWNAAGEVPELLERAAELLAITGQLLIGDPMPEGDASSTASTSQSDDEDRPLSRLGRRVVDDIEAKLRSTIALPPDVPSDAADQLCVERMHLEVLAGELRHASDMKDILSDAIRDLARAPSNRRPTVASALSARATRALQSYGPALNSLEGFRGGMSRIAVDYFARSLKRLQHIGREISSSFVVLSKLFRARQEAVRLTDTINAIRSTLGVRDDPGSQLNQRLATVSAAFDDATSVCAEAKSELLSKADRSAIQFRRDSLRISLCFGELKHRIRCEQTIAKAKLTLLSVQLRAQWLQQHRKATPGQLDELKAEVLKSKHAVKAMNDELFILTRRGGQASSVEVGEEVQAHWQSGRKAVL